MGWKRVIGSGIVGMILLIPMAWISFNFLDLTGSVTGGLITGLNDLFASVEGGMGIFLTIIGGALIGVFLIFFFPIHWALTYRPDDVVLLIALVLPWILTCSIASALFAKSPRQALHTSWAIGIGYLIIMSALYLIIPTIINTFAPGLGADIIDGLSLGLTDLPYLLAIFTGILEGCLVGSIFGAFVGSLKYKPTDKVKKEKRSKSDKKTTEKMTLLKTSIDVCSNCGEKIKTESDFCTSCGQKI